MEPRNVLKKALLWAGGCLAAFAAFVLLVGFVGWYMANPRIEHRLLNGAKVGSTRAEVIQRLGKPNRVMTEQSEIDVYDSGWTPIPHFPIDKEVLVYRDWQYIAFVYINKEGRVTRVALAKT